MESSDKKMSTIRVMDIEKRRVPSKHYVFVLEITWVDGTQNVIYRRYSQFFALQTSLIDAFPVEGGVKNPAERILPFLPGKVLFRSNVREVALKRKGALEDYCKNMVKLPEYILHSEYVTSFFEATQDDIGNLTNSLIDGKRKKSEKRADVISGPVLLEQYIAMADFKKSGRGQVSLNAGDIVDVIEKSENGWYFVSFDDEQGWVPSSYLETVSGTQEDTPVENCLTEEKFVCIKPYTAAFQDEIDLDLGAIVNVFQKGSDGWWHVRYRGKEGWAPMAYLKSAAHLSLAANVDVMKDNEHFKEKKTLKVALPPRRKTVKRTVNAKIRAASIRRSQTKKPSEYVALSDYQMQIGQKNVSISQGNLFEVIEKAPNGWSLVKIGNEEGWVPTDIISRQRTAVSSVLAEDEDIYENVKTVAIEKLNSMNKSDDENNNAPCNDKCITIGAYVNKEASGISFSEGAIVDVLERNESGWWFIRIGAEEGWAPSTYLSPIGPKKVLQSGPAQAREIIGIAIPPSKPNRKSEIPQAYENNSIAKSKTPSPVNQLSGVQKPNRPASPNIKKLPPSNFAVPKPRTSPGLGVPLTGVKAASPTPQARKLFLTKGTLSMDDTHSERTTRASPDRKTPPPKPLTNRTRKISEPARLYRPPPPTISNGRKVSDETVKVIKRISPAIPERPKLEAADIYVTLSAYSDDDEGMLQFRAGERVEVLEKDDGGWWLARIGVKKGWVPSNFLKKE